ncbi:MAG: hypothetical protein JKY41_03290 [Rhodobacteraceae bacterium]|nr:hypothetical protein [Paracoccaceae bacterium]
MNYTTYKITNEGHKPFTITPKGRILETFNKLRNGPVLAPALTRRSDHIFRLRKLGVLIETEMREQKQNGSERYGVYHLLSKISKVDEAKVEGA